MRVSGLSAVVLAAVVSAQAASAQTVIKAPKNKYTPAQDVQLGQEAAAQVEQQLPILHDDNVTSYVQEIGRRLVDSIPAESASSGIPLHVQGRERERDQRVCAARRTDVRQPRHDRAGENRRRSRRRHGPRDESRRAAPRHRPGDKGDQIRDRARSPAPSSAPSSAARPAASSPRARSSASGPHFSDSAANSRSRRTSRAHRSWRARDTTRATWRTCSRPSRSRAAPAARSG